MVQPDEVCWDRMVSPPGDQPEPIWAWVTRDKLQMRANAARVLTIRFSDFITLSGVEVTSF